MIITIQVEQQLYILGKMRVICISQKKCRITGFCFEDFNLVIGSIRNIKICDHFICDIL